MQAPKLRASPLEVPQKTSPATPRTARQGKTPGSGSDSLSSHPGSRTPKERSLKVMERKSPRSPAPEKKRPSRVSELESQLAQLQEDLKKTKEQLSSSESFKRRALQEADEAKKHVLTMSAKLEDSQQQLLELSASEEDRVQELRKISHDRDLVWQSELEAIQKQHSMDTASLASALNDIQRLKVQLEMAAASESAQKKQAESTSTEIQSLREELAETLSVAENLKAEVRVCRESELKAQSQLEMAKKTEETLRSEAVKAEEAYDSVVLELKQSKAQLNSLEGLLSSEGSNSNKIEAELNLVKAEASQLRSALDAAEVRYQEEYIQSTLQIRSAYELVERAKSDSSLREAEFKAELEKARSEIGELKAKLIDKETKLQGILEENEGLNLKIEKNTSRERESEMELELKKLEVDLSEMKSVLMDKEMNLQSIVEENDTLKLEIKKKDTDGSTMIDETDKHIRRVARVTEQLDSAQVANSELEAELRRLKVQSDQWRKAAEAAATMLSPGSNKKCLEKMGSLDSNYQTIGGKMGSPYSDDTDDDLPKKNGNMLKKIGGLWKKGQK